MTYDTQRIVRGRVRIEIDVPRSCRDIPLPLPGFYFLCFMDLSDAAEAMNSHIDRAIEDAIEAEL